MATKRKQLTVDEVKSYVLEPGSESEKMSELEDSEDEVPEVADRLQEVLN